MTDMTLSEELAWRGFINQTTFANIKELDNKKQWVFYNGYDASADSQTVGNLAAMMLDRVFMRHGHKAIILAGGATSLIGDPGGKDAERSLQDEATIAHNVKKAEQQLKQVFAGHDFRLVNNLDWTKNLTVIEFLRDVGKYFSMTPLVQRDYIAKRMGKGGSGISYTEISYTLLQGYDYLHLHDKYGVELQLAGSDQWGNCISGIELIRKVTGDEVHALTMPLIINRATGKKFGKSEDGTVWLDPHKTSAYQFYQFWLNADDEGVEDYLKIYTELNKPQIDKVMQEFHRSKSGRAAQKRLAFEVTKLVHGLPAAESQRRIADVLFGSEDPLELGPKEFDILAKELPVVTVPKHMSMENLVEALVAARLAVSKTEARRFLAEGAVYINNVQITDPSSFYFDKIAAQAVIRRGKNAQAVIRMVD